MVLASLLVLLLSLGSSESLISANFLRGNQAAYLAEAGFERAMAQMIAAPSMISAARPDITFLFNRERLGGFGSYSVSYRANGPDAILLESTGQGSGNAQRLLRAVVTTRFIPSVALLAERAVVIRGNSRVQGELGSVHSNLVLDITGGTIGHDATASGSFAGGGATIGGKQGAGFPRREIPQLDLTALRPLADFILGDADILEVKTGIIHPSGWLGWELVGPGEWRNRSGDLQNGVYFALKKISIDGSPGTLALPWKTTLIAGEEITINGGAVMTPAVQDLLIAGGRMITAGGQATLTGLLIANEVVELGGTASLIGSAVSQGEVRVRDEVVVRLEGPLRTPFRIAPWVVSWSLISS
ncbi:MAG TPA: hypothetical protein VJO34_01750 [Methylomirabilota bacterium]|nr:hypothetical protein [Methylomirabilota bacterium]